MAMLLGKKVGMTQVYDESGSLLPVTVIQAGPCMVMQVKTSETDGYNAVQLGYDDVKPSRRKKPETGHADKAIHYLLAAGDRAQQFHAHDEAAVAFERALNFLRQSPNHSGSVCCPPVPLFLKIVMRS